MQKKVLKCREIAWNLNITGKNAQKMLKNGQKLPFKPPEKITFLYILYLKVENKALNKCFNMFFLRKILFGVMKILFFVEKWPFLRFHNFLDFSQFLKIFYVDIPDKKCCLQPFYEKNWAINSS
jgi:hypothetical protein